MTGGGLIQLLTVGVEDAPLILNPEITFFKTVYRKHTNFSIEQIVKNIGTKKFDCFHQFKIEKVTDLLAGLHFIIDIPYFDVLKTVTTEIINNPDIININELSIMYSNIKTYLFFESTSNNYYLIPENFFNLSEIDNFTNNIDGIELEKNLLKDLNIINSEDYKFKVEILELKNSTLNQILPVIRLNFDNWTEFWLKIINKRENFNYFTLLTSQLSLIDDFNKRLNLIIYDKFNNYNIFYDNKEYLNFSDEIKNYYLLENNILELENPIFDSDYAVNYAIKNNLDIEKCKFDTLKFNSLFFLFLLQTLYPDFTTNIKSFTFWKKYNLFENNKINYELPVTTNNYFLEWSNRFDFYKETSYGIEYEKLNIEIYNKFFKKYNECETNINLLFNTIDIKEKKKLWCILYTIYLRFNNKDTSTPLNKICFDDYFIINEYNMRPFYIPPIIDPDSILIETEINKNEKYYSSLQNINLVKDNLSNFDKYGYIQPVDLALIYVYLCYNYIDSILSDDIFNMFYFLILWRNKINIAYFFRTADILDNYNSDNIKNNSLKNVFNSLHDYNETNKLLTFYHNINLTREINLDIIRDELIKTIYSESFFGTVDIETNNLDVNDITISPYQNDSSGYTIKNQTIEISEDVTVNFTIENTKIIIKNWNRNIFNQLFIKYNGYYVEMTYFEITDNTVYITNQNLNLDNLSTIDIRTINKFKVPIVNIKDINNNSLCNTSVTSNRIVLYNSIINNINNKQILYDISYNKNYFYQLDIKYIDDSIERINVDFSNNYFMPELDLKFNKIKNINLDYIDLNLQFITDVNNNNISSNDLKIVIPMSQTIPYINGITENVWLIGTQFNNKKIPTKVFISVKYYGSNYYANNTAEHFFNIYGNINTIYYKYSLFRFKNENTLYKPIPNLFSILHHSKNPSLKNYSINQSFYQLPMIFKIITTNNLPLYIFYNINMSENVSIKLNNNNVNKLCPINSSQFYNYNFLIQIEMMPGYFYNYTDIGAIPIIFEYTSLNIKNYYLSKQDLVKKLIEKFDKVFINNLEYGNIIDLLEKSNKLYKNFINDSIQTLKKLGKSIEHVIDTSKIINEINILNYSNRDFDVYSVLAPRYYKTSSMSLGMNTIKISNEWFFLKQIKDIYKPSNKISINLSNYLKNVSTTILKHIEHIKDNNEIIEIFNRNQFQEKYDNTFILQNNILSNIIKIDKYIIETLYDMSNNYSSENTEIYFNNMLINISSNNVVTGNNLFEIYSENSLLTEKFFENKDDYSKEKFNYLGPVEFKNGNFNFNNNNITNIQYILTDDLEIIDLSSVNISNLKTYYNSYKINTYESYINIYPTTTKYIYELEIPSYSVATLSNKGILISGNYYDFFKNNNYILIGDQELILTTTAIIGDSSGSISTFYPIETINIKNIKILNNFKSNIKILGNHIDKLVKLNNKIESITITPDNTFIDLTWVAPYTGEIEIISYLIQKSTDLSNWDNISSPPSITSHRLNNLLNNTIYYFKISVITNDSISHPESNIFIGIPKAKLEVPSKIESITIIQGNTFIDLSWNAPFNGGTNISSYLIQRSTDLSNWVNLSSITTSFRLNNLSNDTKYYFKIRAINMIGFGAESNIFIGIPNLVQSSILASRLKSITITEGNNFIDLSWNSPENEYFNTHVIQNSTDLTNWNDIATTPYLTTSFRVSNLSYNTIYYFRIIANMRVGVPWGYYDVTSNNFVVILRTKVPSKIESVTIIPGNTFIDLSWNAPLFNGGTNISSYMIQSSTDLSNWFTLSSTTTSFRLSNLLNNTKYYFKLRAINNVGISIESNIFIGIPKLVQSPISAKNIDSITITPGNTFIDLSWNIPSTGRTDISSYIIRRSTDLSNWVNLPSITTRTFRVNNLLNDTIYYFIIQGINNGIIQESNIFIGIPITEVPLNVETIVITPGNTFIDLTWDAPYNGGTDISSYLIQKSTDLSNWINLSSTTTSFRLSNLLNDTIYYFKISAINKNGIGPESNIFIGIPKLVSSLLVSSLSNNQYKLIDCIKNGFETYYSIEVLGNIQLYDFSKNQLLPPFTIINNKISYNYDNKNFIIDNFNNDYWYKLDDNIIQGNKLKNLNISGNYNLYLYPNKFLKLIDLSLNDISLNVNISNRILTGLNSNLPKYSYYYINNYVYFIKDISSSYILDDYLVEDIQNTKVYLLDDSHFKMCPSQYISIINTSSTEEILLYVGVTSDRIIIKTVTPGNGQVTLTWLPAKSNTSIINRYRVYSIPGGFDTLVSPITSTGILTGTVKGLTNGTSYTFRILAEDPNNYYIDPLRADSISVIPRLPVNDDYLVSLVSLVPSYSYDFKNKEESELDIYINFSSTIYNFIRPIVFTSNSSVFRVKLSRNSLNYGNFLCYKQSDLLNNQISGTITDINNTIITGLRSIDNNLNISGTSFTLTSKEGIQKYKLYDSNDNYTYIWTLLLDANTYTKYDILFSNKILDPIIINSNSTTLIVDLSNYTDTVITNNNNLLSESNKKLYFNNYFTNITKKQMYYSSFIIGEYKLEKLENNYNSSDIIYCSLDDLGIIQETDINGNQLSIDNFNIYKYIILLDTNSNYKYYNVLSSDKLLKKILVDDEIEKKIYNVYGCKRNLIFTKNKSYIWKSLTNYYLNTNKNCLFIDDIIMLNNNIFRVIGLNSFKNLYEIELIRKYNDLKLFSDGYYLLYSRNIVPNIPKFEPIVDFTYDNTNNSKYKFTISVDEQIEMEINNNTYTNPLLAFCIKEGNNIKLFYKDNKLYNPFNYFLNNGDYIVYDNILYYITFIYNNVIYVNQKLNDDFLNKENNKYYDFYYPYQPCTMENVIFDSSGILIKDNNKNINYLFEDIYPGNKIFTTVKKINIYNSIIYTRVIKVPRNQFYFENKKNNYIQARRDPRSLNDPNYKQFFIIDENLSEYDFFYNQPILINNLIKMITYIDGGIFRITDNFTSRDLDLENIDINNLQIYFGKKNIQNIYSNYLLDKVNYLKPLMNIGKFDYYYILDEDTQSEQIIYKALTNVDNNTENYMRSLKYPVLNFRTLIFEDNVLLRDSSFNFLNYNSSYYILLEKTETNQYVSHLCQIKFQNKLKLFTPVENYKSKFYLDKIYPIKLNIDNTFEYLDLTIYKQTILNKKPSNKIHIFKKFNILVNGIVETITDGYCVKVEIGDLSNYINKYDIYIDKITECTIDLSGSVYYLKTSNYPGEFEYLYVKQINYIKSLFRNGEDFSYLYETFNESRTSKIIEKYPTNESIKLPIYLKDTSDTNFSLQYDISGPNYNLTSYTYTQPVVINGLIQTVYPPVYNLKNALISNITNNNYDNYDNYSIDNLNNIITIQEKISIDKLNGVFYFNTNANRGYVITSTHPITNDKTYIYFNNIRTSIFNESTLQCDIESIFEILFFETDFHHSILFNKLKSWNSWSIISNYNPDISNNRSINSYLFKGPLIYDASGVLGTHTQYIPIYFTNNEFSDLSKALSSSSSSNNFIEKYQKIKNYQEKIYKYLNLFFKYSEFWKDPKTYINKFAIDISSQIIFDGLHLKLDNQIIDDIIINNQFDISYNNLTPTTIYITRDNLKIYNEIYNFINNIKNDSLYGVNILDVLKEIVNISNNLTNIKSIIKNFSFETKNFTDLILNVLKNELYGKTSNLDIDLTELKKSFVVENFQLNDNDVKNNIITYDTSYNFVNFILEYPSDTFKIMNMVNIPYNINYSIDTNSGLYLYKISLLDEKYESYVIYKLDFLSGINTLIEPITINNPIVFNNQINFYYKENFDINIDYVISSFKTYDVSSEELGYLYQVNIPSINFNDFTSIKYKQTELSSYDNYLVSPIYLESFSSYIQAETPIGIYEYKHNISNNQTIITLIKLNISINIGSSQYSVYYNDNSNYYKIEDISGNIITINSKIDKFTNPKIVVTIKLPTTSNTTFKNTKLYRLTLDEPLISYVNYINFNNVPNNFLINNEIKVINMKFITDSIVDVLVESSLSETYKINNLVHYAKIGEYPPEPIEKINKENLYLYRFNKIVPFNDISSCFILYDQEYIKNYNSVEYIDNFIRNISSANYNLSTDVIQDLSGIKFITNKFLKDEDMQYNVFGGVINTFNISNYIYNLSNKTITFTIPQNLIINTDYYYILNNTYLDISNISINQNNLIINWINSVAIVGIIVFKQVIIEKDIIKPRNNQIYNIELFNDFDLNTNGYLQVLNKEGNEVGQFIYKINNTNIHINNLSNSYDVLINDSNMLKGTILYKNPLYIITNELIEKIYSLTIVDTSITLTDISAFLIQNTYIPYEIYKSNGLKKYSLFIQSNNIENIVNLTFLITDENKYSIIGRYGNFKLEKIYQNQKIKPTPELVFNLEKKISYIKTNEREIVKFNSDIYRNIFENIDFCIGDQIIERLDKTTFEMQYQFLKDPQKKNQIDKVTKIYDYEGKMRLNIPLEFWFSNQANMYLPLISLPYTDVSLKFKLNKLNKLLGSNYTIISEPDINIQVNIDGIILDTFERDMFGNNKHEYLIERFMQYPDNLIDKTSSVIKMIFKNPIKDIYYKTEVFNSSDTCYYKTEIIMDDWQKEYKNKRSLYDKFIKTNIYTNNNSKEFEIIKKSINENILQLSERYILFNKSKILKKYDMEMTIYLDEKYQKNFELRRRRYNLELYYTKIYNYKEIKTPIPIIESMTIKSNGTDLFKEISHTYFNKTIPYQKYLNSVDIGYHVYSFSLNPLDNQPSGHLNFSLLDDIVLKSENNSQVLTKPVLLKTIVREYNLLRIMSGLSSLAWID